MRLVMDKRTAQKLGEAGWRMVEPYRGGWLMQPPEEVAQDLSSNG